MIRNSKISVISLSLIGFLLSFAIMYTYGYSKMCIRDRRREADGGRGNAED